MDIDNWDNGTYIIDGWNISERLYAQYPDEKMKDTMFENLKLINSKQPNEEQLKEEELEAFAKLWEVRHLDRLNEERKAEVEKRIEEERKIQEQTYLQSQNINENNNVEQNSSKIEKNGLIMDKGEFLKTFSEDYDTDVQKPIENNLKEELTSYENKGYEEFER